MPALQLPELTPLACERCGLVVTYLTNVLNTKKQQANCPSCQRQLSALADAAPAQAQVQTT